LIGLIIFSGIYKAPASHIKSVLIYFRLGLSQCLSDWSFRGAESISVIDKTKGVSHIVTKLHLLLNSTINPYQSVNFIVVRIDGKTP